VIRTLLAGAIALAPLAGAVAAQTATIQVSVTVLPAAKAVAGRRHASAAQAPETLAERNARETVYAAPLP